MVAAVLLNCGQNVLVCLTRDAKDVEQVDVIEQVNPTAIARDEGSLKISAVIGAKNVAVSAASQWSVAVGWFAGTSNSRVDDR